MVERCHAGRREAEQEAVERLVMIEAAPIVRPFIVIVAADAAAIEITQAPSVADRLPERAGVERDRIADRAPERAYAQRDRQDRVEEDRTEQRGHRVVR